MIVVDDASVDRTSAVCAAIEGIKYIRLERNQGVAGARNVGLLASTGKYIAFLDDDDQRLPGSLDHQVALLEAAPEAGFVAGRMLLGNQDCIPTGETVGPQNQSGDLFWEILELEVPLLPSAIVVRKECFFEIGVFNQKIDGIEDWDMWTRISEKRHVLIDSLPVCIYRSPLPHSGQLSSSMGHQLYSAFRHQSRLLFLPRVKAAKGEVCRAARRNIKKRVVDTLIWRAAENLPQGSFRVTTTNVFYAFLISPLRTCRPSNILAFWNGATRGLKRLVRFDT